MKKILLRKVEILTLCVSVPIAILLLFVFSNKPEIAIAFLVGIILGLFRLYTLFNYINGVLNPETKHKNVVAMLKYMVNLMFSLGAIGYTLYKSVSIGVPILIGVITVPVILMFFSIWHGLSLGRSK